MASPDYHPDLLQSSELVFVLGLNTLKEKHLDACSAQHPVPKLSGNQKMAAAAFAGRAFVRAAPCHMTGGFLLTMWVLTHRYALRDSISKMFRE